eukprot:scaffold99352_cov33-Prasinocladus_malaysianus.AAC.1
MTLVQGSAGAAIYKGSLHCPYCMYLYATPPHHSYATPLKPEVLVYGRELMGYSLGRLDDDTIRQSPSYRGGPG